MGAFEIIGGNRLEGEITPQGAKNETLQILCAVLLTSEKVIIKKVPNIRDVNKLIDLLECMGVKVNKLGEEEYEFPFIVTKELVEKIFFEFLELP